MNGRMRSTCWLTLPLLSFAAGGQAADGNPQASFHSGDFNTAKTCQECHPRQYLEWRGSTHAYALVDPFFVACNRKAIEQTRGDIGTSCLECHSPIGVRSGELRGVFEESALSPQSREGITCEACHRAEPPLAESTRTNANFELTPGKVLFGSLHKPEANSFHESATSRFLGQSEFCGTCHDVVHNSRKIEKTFTEWADSELSGPERVVLCQDCHMLRYSGRAAVGGPFRDELRRHNFPGVSLPLSPVPNRGYQKEEIQRFLRTAARMTVFVPEAVEAGGVLDLTVGVKNSGTGHNLPAASMRQMWLEVTALDSDGRALYRSGHLDAAGDLMDHRSKLRPDGDPDLVVFSDAHLDAQGEEVPYWRATQLREGSLRHLEVHYASYRIAVAAALEGSALRLRVRLLFRAFAPFALRSLGLADLINDVPVWEMDAFDSAPLPVVREVPRKTEYRLPGDFSSLQAAVDLLQDGDSVQVAAGEYTLQRALDFRGKGVAIVSREGPDRTVLRLEPDLADAERGSVVVFRSGEGPRARLEGFTITGGRGTLVDGLRRGGGIYIHRSSPTLKGNRIFRNSAAGGVGGGIYCEEGAPVIVGNDILACRAARGGGLALRMSAASTITLEGNSMQGNIARQGGGLYVDRGRRVRLVHSVVAGNQARREGGGVFAANGVKIDVDHATFVHNRAVERSGAIGVQPQKNFTVSNSIFWSNRPFRPAEEFTYCVLDAETPGVPTNLFSLPLFTDPSEPWFERRLSAFKELRFRDARWLSLWGVGDYQPLPDSPAIDAGDPAAPADPDDTRSDVGAFFLEQPLRGFVRGDTDGNGRVGGEDLVALLTSLLEGREISCLDAADVDDGGAVNPLDAVWLARFLCSETPRIAHPFPQCGLDPTFGEGLSCQEEPGPCGDASAEAYPVAGKGSAGTPRKLRETP